MRAFTLLETLIYVGLFSLMMTGIFVAAAAVRESSEYAHTKARLFSENIYLVDRFDAEIKQAESISSPESNGSSKVLRFSQGSTGVSIYVASTTLMKQSVAGVGSISDGDISIQNLSFAHARSSSGAEMLHISAKLSAYAGTVLVSFPFTHVVYLRP